MDDPEGHPEAIVVKDLEFSYGSSRCARLKWLGKCCREPFKVLRSIDLTVKRASIYGLLGPSGTGKTTLLECILGMLHCQAGSVRVFGHKPGTRISGLPGPACGYMPQDISLVAELTTYETLLYYGLIQGMALSRIRERISFLADLLRLPTGRESITTTVHVMSAGQQRRLSLASALIHEPELLILDEPTVGVDPTLRLEIWKYLRKLVNDEGSSIIVTTHYVEECRLADTIGMMKSGFMIAQASPAELMRAQETDDLEAIFVRLFRRHNVSVDQVPNLPESSSTTQLQSPTTSSEEVRQRAAAGERSSAGADPVAMRKASSHVDEFDFDDEDEAKGSKRYKRRFIPRAAPRFLPSGIHLLALMVRNMVVLLRTPSIYVFQLLFVALQVALFCLTIGSGPNKENRPVVAVAGAPASMCHAPLSSRPQCALLLQESCVSKKDADRHFKDFRVERWNVTTAAEVERKLKSGDAWAALLYSNGFEALLKSSVVAEAAGRAQFQRLAEGAGPDTVHTQLKGAVTQAGIPLKLAGGVPAQLYMDGSVPFSAIFAMTELKTGLETCLRGPAKKSALRIADSPPVPYQFNPKFGSDAGSTLDFLAPTVIALVPFYMSSTLTSSQIVQDKITGVLYRSIASGVRASSIILSQVMTSFLLGAVQAVLAVVLVLFAFDVTNRGSVAVVLLVGVLNSILGIVTGIYTHHHHHHQISHPVVGRQYI
ncbi:unnamed protein product, partial [Notodromas monacha]